MISKKGVMQINKAKTFGIQGGRGSFNEQALCGFLGTQGIDPSSVAIEYLFTTERVLQALKDGNIEIGQFAVHNTINGPVQRSIDAMEEFQFPQHFREIARHSLAISHSLMIHLSVQLSEIKAIISHPTVFIQCANNLRQRYPNLTQINGEGALEDPARAAEAIVSGELPRTYATLSSKRIAEIFGLKVVDHNLQDHNPNVSTFVLATLRDNGV